MGWIGRMTCQVNNLTGHTMAVVMGHRFGDFTDSLPFQVLKNGESTRFTICVGSESNDYWSVYFMTDDGKYYYRPDKQCNVEHSDLASGQPVMVNLKRTGFDVSTPASSPCDDNDLFTCPSS